MERKRIISIILLLIFIIAIPAALSIKEWMERPEPDYDRKPESHYSLGMTQLRSGNLESAVEELKEAIRIEPGNMDARYSLGVAYQRMGRPEDALQEYHTVVKSIPNSFQVFNNVGLIHLDTGDYDKAIQALNHAIEIRPDYYQAYLNLGKAYEARGEERLARKVYQKVQKMASERDEAMAYAREAEKRLEGLER